MRPTSKRSEESVRRGEGEPEVPTFEKPSVSLHPVKVVVTRQIGKLPEDRREEIVEVRPFITDVAHVEAAIGFTVNTGDFNSVRFSTMVTLPCYVEDREKAKLECQQEVMAWVKKLGEDLRLKPR